MGVRSSIESLRFQLPFNFKVDASGCPVLGNFLAVKHHLEFSYPRPLHAAHGLRCLCNGVLGGLSKALLRCVYDLDDFLGHGLSPLVEPEYIALLEDVRSADEQEKEGPCRRSEVEIRCAASFRETSCSAGSLHMLNTRR